MDIAHRKFRRFADGSAEQLALLTGGVSGAASIWIFCLMVLICADIFGRTVLNAPVQGVSEIVANSIVAIVFLQAAHTLMSGRMTRTDILIGAAEEHRPFAASILRLVFHLAGVLVFALIAYGTWPKLVDAWVENEFFGAQGVFTAPVWPIKACLFGGSLLTCLAFATQALKDLKEALGHSRVEPLTIRHSVVRTPRGWPILIAFVAMVSTGLRIAIDTRSDFGTLLATALATLIGVQAFIIIGGVIRVVPLTGITLPFVSYGGSSLVANYVLVALLLRISHERSTRATEVDPATPATLTTQEVGA